MNSYDTIHGSSIDENKIPVCCSVSTKGIIHMAGVRCNFPLSCSVAVCYFRDGKR